MSDSRIKNTIRNFGFNFGAYLINLAMSFLTRTVFIWVLNAEYLGVNGLFSNLLSVLALTELGAGGAFVSLLYKPIAENDDQKVAVIIRAFQKTYTAIACVIGIIGISLIPFMEHLIPQNNIDNIILIYLLYIINMMVSYICVAPKDLIKANQKTYIVTYYSQIFIIAQYLMQIIILICTHRFIAYLLIQVCCAACSNIYISYKARRMYPFICQKTEPLSPELKKEVVEKIKGGFCVHASFAIYTGTDSLIISHFLGLGVLGVYSNYLLIIGIIEKLVIMLFDSVRASASNFALVSDKVTNYVFFRKLNFFAFVLMGFFGTCLIILFNSFIEIWIGTKFTLNFTLVILAVLLYILGWRGIKLPLSIYRDAFGLYYNDRYVSLLEAFMNIILSVILVQKIGLAGVFIGSIISSFCTIISSTFLIYTKIFEEPVYKYWTDAFKYTFIMTAVGMFSFFLCKNIEVVSFVTFFIKAIVCAVVTLCCYYIVFRKTEEYKYFESILKKVVKIK